MRWTFAFPAHLGYFGTQAADAHAGGASRTGVVRVYVKRADARHLHEKCDAYRVTFSARSGMVIGRKKQSSRSNNKPFS